MVARVVLQLLLLPPPPRQNQNILAAGGKNNSDGQEKPLKYVVAMTLGQINFDCIIHTYKILKPVGWL